MTRQTKGMRVRVDRYTRVCLTAIAVLLTVLILGLWTEVPSAARSARAQPKSRRDVFVDSAKQRDQLVKAMDRQTSKLDQLIALLKSGQVKVQTISADGKKKEE